MNENEKLQSEFPGLLTEDYKFMKTIFYRSFLRKHPMLLFLGTVLHGRASARRARLEKEICDQIDLWLESKITRKVNELLNALWMAAYSKLIGLECDRFSRADLGNKLLMVNGRASLFGK